MSTREWPWSEALRAEFAAWGCRWRVVDMEFDRAVLGSSPDYAVFLDGVVVLQADTPERWVAHELGHFIVAQRLAPELLQLYNYGFEEPDGDFSPAYIAEEKLGGVSMEGMASNVALALLVDLGLDHEDYVEHILHDREDLRWGCLMADEVADSVAQVLPAERLAALRALEVIIL